MLILLATMGCMRRDLAGTWFGAFDCEIALDEGTESCTGEMFVSVFPVGDRRQSYAMLELGGSCGAAGEELERSWRGAREELERSW